MLACSNPLPRPSNPLPTGCVFHPPIPPLRWNTPAVGSGGQRLREAPYPKVGTGGALRPTSLTGGSRWIRASSHFWPAY
jgi:hypothetical protein